MKIKHVVDAFKNVDLSTWEIVPNRTRNSLWLTPDVSIESSIKIFIRKDTDGEINVRLFKFHQLGDFDNYNYRIIMYDNQLVLNTLLSNYTEDIVEVNDYTNLTSEEVFFQQSLLHDFGDLQYEDINTPVSYTHLTLPTICSV